MRDGGVPIVCPACREKVLETLPRYLTPGQRLWGKCFEVDQCWHFGTPGNDGRPAKIMVDRYQKQASHIALFLAGNPQPSPEHVARARCLQKMCVNPDHLEWVVRPSRAAGYMWAQGLDRDDLLTLMATERANRAKYQRNYRAKLRRLEVGSVRELLERDRAAAAKPSAGVVVAAPSDPVPTAPAAKPGRAAVPASVEPAPASGLLASLAGAKIAPVD